MIGTIRPLLVCPFLPKARHKGPHFGGFRNFRDPNCSFSSPQHCFLRDFVCSAVYRKFSTIMWMGCSCITHNFKLVLNHINCRLRITLPRVSSQHHFTIQFDNYSVTPYNGSWCSEGSILSSSCAQTKAQVCCGQKTATTSTCVWLCSEMGGEGRGGEGWGVKKATIAS